MGGHAALYYGVLRNTLDLVDHEQQTCEAGSEQTFKLIGIVHYRGTEAQWHNDRGQPWSVERLLKEELPAPISPRQATCGGSHRLYALHYAAEVRTREGLPLTGAWLEASRRVSTYQRRAFRHGTETEQH